MKQQAYLFGLIAVLLLSSNATGIAIASQYAHPMTALALSSMLIVLITLKQTVAFVKTHKSLFTTPIFWGMAALKLVNDVSFFYILGSTRQIDATIVIYLYPVSNIILSSLILDQRYHRLTLRSWLLVAAALASVALLSPLSIMSDLSGPIFMICLLSATASAYLVLIQKISDDIYGKEIAGGGLIGLLYLINLTAYVPGLLLLSSFDVQLISWEPRDMVFLGLACLWLGPIANYASDVIWIRAARVYEDISLKSMLFLSPVLGALYLSFFGFDSLSPLVVFALTGVVVANFMLHQEWVDDLSFVIFIFSIVGFTVLMVNASNYFDRDILFVQTELFDIHVATVSIFMGFLLFRAFDVYAKLSEAFLDLALELSGKMNETGMTSQQLESALDDLLDMPDLGGWNDTQRETHRMFLQALAKRDCATAYLRFFQVRFTGTSYSEVFFGFVISISVVALIAASTIDSERLTFLSIFLMAIFVFIPFFMLDLIGGRALRPYCGILARRVAWGGASGFEDAKNPSQFRFRQHQRTRIGVMLGLAVVLSGASWILIRSV